MLKDLVVKNRSYRKFHEEIVISRDILEELIDLSRISASAANLQPLKYLLSFSKDKNDLIFPHLTWAAYLQDWDGPKKGERPSAYIIILCDTDIFSNCGCDYGIAAQTILLGATEKGFGGCMIGNINKNELRNALTISERYDILLVVALGKPKEHVVLETVKPDGDIRYYRSEDGTHHVPKRALGDVILDV